MFDLVDPLACSFPLVIDHIAFVIWSISCNFQHQQGEHFPTWNVASWYQLMTYYQFDVNW